MKLTLALLTLFTISPHSPAQTGLTREVKAKAITAFIKDFKAHYVFPDLADKASTLIQGRLDHGYYDTVTNGADLAKAITDGLHEVCQDAHLQILFSEKSLPDRKADDKPTPEEIKAQQRQSVFVNGGYENVERLPGNIGYLEVRGFFDAEAAKSRAAAAMTFLENTDALILDLRRNGGGDPESVKTLLSYFFGKRTHLNDVYFRQGNNTIEFWTNERISGPKYLDKPIYVLTSKRTASAAEECAYDLQCLHRATIVGTSTWGGANPGDVYRLTDHFGAFIPSGRAINPYTKKNWEGTGVIPNVAESGDALVSAEKLALKKLLETASGDDKNRYRQSLDDLSKASS